jgi:hypothetical protein
MEMKIPGTISKRQRIVSLVKKSIDDTARTGAHSKQPNSLVTEVVRDFSDAWHAKYFGMADDRKIAGLVLAYMMESSELGIHDVNARGYALLKLTAEVDIEEFRKNAPRTFEQLQRRNMLGPGAGELKGV